MNVLLRPAEETDVATILSWRNQHANREVSNNRHEISPEEHRVWWGRTQGDPSRRVLLFVIDEIPRGVVNFFDLEPADSPRVGGWGFFLDHEKATAEGTAMQLWTRVMIEAVNYAFDDLGLDVLRAEVLAENQAVRTMNRRFRFAEEMPVEKDLDGRTISVIPTSLRREDRRPTRRSK